MKRFFWLFLLWLPTLLGADSTEDDRRQVLQFGIDSDVLALLQTLESEKNTKFDDDILKILEETKSKKLQQGIVKFFAGVKEPKAENWVLQELAKAKDDSASLLAPACLYYLGETDAKKSEDLLVSLMESPNKNLAVVAIRTLGKLKAKKAGPAILKKLKDPDFDDKLKGDLIWTLGEIGDVEASKELIGLWADYSERPASRQLILEALGKLKTPEALAKLLDSVSDDSAAIRAQAIKSLQNFPDNKDVVQAVLTALKDGQAPVRLSALEAAGVLKKSEFVPTIQFRVRKDPDPKVRSAALKALVNWDPSLAASATKDLLLDKSLDLGLWTEVLSLALEKGVPTTREALNQVLDREAKERFSPYPDIIASRLGAKASGDLQDLYKRLLTSQEPGQKIQALKGIAANKIKALTETVRAITKDPKEESSVKRQAEETLKVLAP